MEQGRYTADVPIRGSHAKKKNMSESTQIQNWSRVCQALLEKERHLAQLLVIEARGDVGADVVKRVRSEVDALQRLADAAFEAALRGAVR